MEETMVLVVLEKTLETPLGIKENKPVNPKGNQTWIFIGRYMKLKLQYFATWCEEPTHQKSTIPGAGKDVGQEEKGETRMKCLDSIINSMDMNLNKIQGS